MVAFVALVPGTGSESELKLVVVFLFLVTIADLLAFFFCAPLAIGKIRFLVTSFVADLTTTFFLLVIRFFALLDDACGEGVGGVGLESDSGLDSELRARDLKITS